jgi:glycosyltransferase involved in cell wall biosynthesis
VPGEDVDKLREAIEQMMDSYSFYQPEAIRKFAVENYSAEKFISRIEKVYQSVS